MSTPIYSISWFIALLISMVLIFQFIGFSGLTRMFPEGHRSWHFPAQLGTLLLFAIVILYHPT